MKLLLVTFVLSVCTVFGQTRINLSEVKPATPPPTVAVYLLAVGPGGFLPIVADTDTLSLDMGTTPLPTLRVKNSGGNSGGTGPVLTDVDDEFSGQNVTYTTSATPKGRLFVFRNGLRQSEKNGDFTKVTNAFSGSVTITPASSTPTDWWCLSYQK